MLFPASRRCLFLSSSIAPPSSYRGGAVMLRRLARRGRLLASQTPTSPLSAVASTSQVASAATTTSCPNWCISNKRVFSSDATATSTTATSNNQQQRAIPIQRSKQVLEALEQLPSNLRFDVRSKCIPLVVASSNTKLTSPAVDIKDEIGDEQQGDDDDDTVITKSRPTAKHRKSSTTSHYNDYNNRPVHQHPPLKSDIVAIPLPQRLTVPVQDILSTGSKRTTKRHGGDDDAITLSAHIFGHDPIRVDLIKRAVEYQRNRQRGKRKALAKSIGMVSGSGKKVRQQKGTGKARAGHSRPPHWRGGAVAHGPKGKIQDYGNTKLNIKVRQLAVQHALSQKLKEQNLIVVDTIQDKLPSYQTKVLAKLLLTKWNIGGRTGKSALILDVVSELQQQRREHEHEIKNQGHEETEDHSEDATLGAELKDATTTTTTAGATIHPLLETLKPQHVHDGGGLPLKVQVATGNIAHVHAENVWFANVYNILKYEKLILTLAAVKVLEQRFGLH